MNDKRGDYYPSVYPLGFCPSLIVFSSWVHPSALANAGRHHQIWAHSQDLGVSCCTEAEWHGIFCLGAFQHTGAKIRCWKLRPWHLWLGKGQHRSFYLLLYTCNPFITRHQDLDWAARKDTESRAWFLLSGLLFILVCCVFFLQSHGKFSQTWTELC